MRALVKRHILCYIRDRWAVFFSFLSVLIILALFAFFLGTMQESYFRGVDDAEYVIYGWLLAGVLMVATSTVPLGFMEIMTGDRTRKNINDFYVTPLSRAKIVMSYLIAAVTISTILGIVNLAVGQIVLLFNAGTILPLFDLLRVMGLIVLSSALFSTVFFFVVSFLKTGSAHGTLATLFGTLVGFLTAIYVPLQALGSTLTGFLSALPTLQAAALFRTVYMREAVGELFAGADEALATYKSDFGLEIDLFGLSPDPWVLFLMLVGWTVLFFGLSVWRLSRVKL